MKIAIIGAGNVGASLGRAFAANGHQVRFGVRDPDKIAELVSGASETASASSIREAAEFGEVVILAVPWNAARAAIEAAGDLRGKVLIDAVNPLAWNDGPVIAEDVQGSSAAQKIAEMSHARVVKAFSTHGAEFNLAPMIHDIPVDTYICGDDEEAKVIVRSLAEDLGFSVIDAGPLRNASLIENMAALWVYLAVKTELGRTFVFKALSRV
jgi:hypothetical protein